MIATFCTLVSSMTATRCTLVNIVTSPELSVAERKKFVKGTTKLLLRVIISAIICYMDSTFYQVRHSESRDTSLPSHWLSIRSLFYRF